MTRLQKLLADAGLGSRRGIEQWIRDGRLTISGRTAQLGDRATPSDVICLDGVRLDLSSAKSPSREVLLYHKPLGEVTTRSDPQGRPTVFGRLPQPRHGRWIAVGRLDVNTSGLLLLTTDGELAHRLMHPSSEIDREYVVRIRGTPAPGVLERLLAGVSLEDGSARFDQIEPQPGRGSAPERGTARGPRDGKKDTGEDTLQDEPRHGGSHATFRVVIHEGRNREVRRLWSAVGFEVSRLRRVRYGPVKLPPDLRPGQWRAANGSLVEVLARALMLPREPGAVQDGDRGSTGGMSSR
ncbi:MAG TPA: pseudouridine synthase [Steroidobacteraceae bacterium]|nr:pseudouridine synthase [Steroidobacteraceae bacterium]